MTTKYIYFLLQIAIFYMQKVTSPVGAENAGYSFFTFSPARLCQFDAGATRDLSLSVRKANAFLQNSKFQHLLLPPVGRNWGTWPCLAAGNTGVEQRARCGASQQGRRELRWLWRAGDRSQVTRQETGWAKTGGLPQGTQLMSGRAGCRTWCTLALKVHIVPLCHCGGFLNISIIIR